MPSLTELASYLESIAPAQIAESWDNVGVLVRCAQEVTGVLCALDITPATVREARAVGCNAIVSHHPVIFRPLKELRQDDVPALLVREGVSAVCMHTNLDKAQGGVNDVLAQALGLRDTEPFAGGIGRVGALPETMEAAAFAAICGQGACRAREMGGRPRPGAPRGRCERQRRRFFRRGGRRGRGLPCDGRGRAP